MSAPFRVLLVDRAGVVWSEMTVLRGLDRSPDVRFYHAFGPAGALVPQELQVVARPKPEGATHVQVETYQDPDGMWRFKPVTPLQQTLN